MVQQIVGANPPTHPVSLPILLTMPSAWSRCHDDRMTGLKVAANRMSKMVVFAEREREEQAGFIPPRIWCGVRAPAITK